MMSRLIKKLRNNKLVIFDKGRIDFWCVYLVENNRKYAPSDVTYFTDFLNISKLYPPGKVYQDFVSIYNVTTKSVDQQVLNLIDVITDTYQEVHQLLMEQWFTVIYAGMIAEENKENAVLKKRIKRLGMYQVLVLGIIPPVAAKFSIGKKAGELRSIMQSYGF